MKIPIYKYCPVGRAYNSVPLRAVRYGQCFGGGERSVFKLIKTVFSAHVFNRSAERKER